MQWLPYLIIASLAGLINIVSAWYELDKKCQALPFFKPHKNAGFWIWFLFQFISPSVLAWFLFSYSSQPTINLKLIAEALTLGIGFVALLNASTEVGSFSIKLKPIYLFFIDIAYKLIAAQETQKSALFWADLEHQEFIQKSIDSKRGIAYLSSYFKEDISLSQQEKQSYLDQLSKLSSAKLKPKDIATVISLIKAVRRKDLSTVLLQFKCSDRFIAKLLN